MSVAAEQRQPRTNGVSARQRVGLLALVRSSVRVHDSGWYINRGSDVVWHMNLEMAMRCFLCEQRSEDTEEIPSDVFPEDEDRWKQWLDAIGEANEDVLSQLALCSRHFSQACSAGLILMDNIVPISTLELAPTSYDSIAKAAKVDRSSPKIEPKTKRSPSPLLLGSLPSSIKRPIITKGRRIHMLSKEEMKEQPIKYVRYLKHVNWDEISKVPEEAKIVWEVAMEELKEDNDKIKDLQAHVRQLSVTVQKLKNALKMRRRTTSTNSLR